MDHIQSKNFLIEANAILSRMEDQVEEYIKSGNEKEKDLEAIWKQTNQSKQQKQHEVAKVYKTMAFVSAALLVTSAACSIGSVALSSRAGITDLDKQAADLLASLGNNGTSFGSRVADNLSQNSTQNTSALIEELTQNSTKVWESDKRTNESRKEALKSLLTDMQNAKASMIDKSGGAFSFRG